MINPGSRKFVTALIAPLCLLALSPVSAAAAWGPSQADAGSLRWRDGALIEARWQTGGWPAMSQKERLRYIRRCHEAVGAFRSFHAAFRADMSPSHIEAFRPHLEMADRVWRKSVQVESRVRNEGGVSQAEYDRIAEEADAAMSAETQAHIRRRDVRGHGKLLGDILRDCDATYNRRYPDIQ